MCTVAGFNRYMVECEFIKFTNIAGIGNGFNRYMVECEYQRMIYIMKKLRVLIDTWWNVNQILDLLVSWLPQF